MILNVYMHKNMKIDCFTQPIFTDIEPEKVGVQESRSLQITEDVKILNSYKDLVLFFVGTFDDSTGEIITKDENGDLLLSELLDDRPIVAHRLDELKGVTDNA